METEKDTFHVVIRLPFKRPDGFVEPPAIVWTEEMEHKLWQYMSQKNTDWTAIAEQLGVPTSYIVRHAAFIYETQLRGIHQQLRLNTNTASMTSRNNAKSPTPSKPARQTSIRYSNSLQYQQYNNQDHKIMDSQNSLLSSQTPKRATSPSSLHKSSSTISNQPLQSTVTAYVDTSEEDDGHSSNTNSHHSDIREDEQEFSSHFARMKLQVEEPAFLPIRPGSSSSSNSLSNSRQQLSISIQNLRKLNAMETPTINQPPGSNTESALNSIGSSFSDLSDSSVTQSALEEAFLSKFNQGSKMSTMLQFSRKYKE